MERYFNSGLLSVNYDFGVTQVPESVLSVPLLGLLVPLAWATGADVTAGQVDLRFLASLADVAAVMRKLYPTVQISTEVRCDTVDTPWPFTDSKTCLLYSGGVDSTSSMIRNLGPGLILASIRGTPDLRLWEGEFWDRVESSLRPFVSSVGLERHVIETNALDVVNFTSLNASMKQAFDHGWWENLSHGLILLSMCAPLTYSGGIGKMMIASSYSQGASEPWGSTPDSDEKVAWGQVAVVHDSFDMSRLQKTEKILAPYMVEHPGVVKLRVCTGKRSMRLASGTLNCGRCQKCVRTMLSLMWAGIDPTDCGFPSPDFDEMRTGLISGSLRSSPSYTMNTIRTSRKPPSERLAATYPGYKGFLDWFYTWKMPAKVRKDGALTWLAPRGSRRRRVLSAMTR